MYVSLVVENGKTAFVGGLQLLHPMLHRYSLALSNLI